MGCVIQVCWQLASRIRTKPVPSWSCSLAVSKPVWHIPLLCIVWKTPDDGQRNCAKHAEFYSKNKFEKFVYLIGFIIRIYNGARSPERQNHVIPKLWYALQGCGILEAWEIKFVLSSCQNNYYFIRSHLFIKLILWRCFTKLQVGREDLFIFWDGRDHVKETTCSKAIKD